MNQYIFWQHKTAKSLKRKIVLILLNFFEAIYANIGA